MESKTACRDFIIIKDDNNYDKVVKITVTLIITSTGAVG